MIATICVKYRLWTPPRSMAIYNVSKFSFQTPVNDFDCCMKSFENMACFGAYEFFAVQQLHQNYRAKLFIIKMTRHKWNELIFIFILMLKVL